jgi:hypothetical protein
MQINQTVLETVVTEAISKCGGNKRWANAVRKAAEELVTNPYLHHDGHSLLICRRQVRCTMRAACASAKPSLRINRAGIAPRNVWWNWQ